MKEFGKALAVNLLTVVCLIPYLPLLLFGLGAIVIKCLFLKLKLLTGVACQRTGRVGVISYKYPISDITKVADEDELEFLKFRSPLYLYRMTVWGAREIARYLLGYQKFWVISEETLIFTLTHSLYAHSLRFDEELQMYRMVFDGLEHFNLYKNFYWEVREVRFNREHTKMSIILKDGVEAHWPCTEDKMPDWTLAKMHAQVGLTFSAPGLSHTHVHFVFPSTTAVITKTVLPRGSFLRRLLEPHIRFTERINYQALNINVSTDNTQTLLDKYYFMWKVIPLNKEQFIEGVIDKCHKHYHKECRGRIGASGDKEKRQHPHFPPPYVQDEKYQEVPYLRFLATYYEPVKRFVESVAHLIDRREWEDMSRAMARHVPGIDEVDMVEVITTFIHNVAIVHYCDHIVFARTYGYKYACMEMRYPYESFDNVEVWNDLLANEPDLTYEKVRRNPELLMKIKHVTRTRIFANIFVDYIPDVVHDLSLLAVKYDFDEKAERSAIEAAQRFKRDLKAVDKALQQEELGAMIPGRPLDKDLPQTMQILPVEDFISTICF